jgi:hypothetical protein
LGKPYLLAVRSDKEGTFVSTSDILLWQQLQKGSGLHVALKEYCVQRSLVNARVVGPPKKGNLPTLAPRAWQVQPWASPSRRASDRHPHSELHTVMRRDAIGVCNPTFRGTGITTYLENGGTLEKARQMAAHASTRTTQLCDRREDCVTLDEVVKINIRG